MKNSFKIIYIIIISILLCSLCSCTKNIDSDEEGINSTSTYNTSPTSEESVHILSETKDNNALIELIGGFSAHQKMEDSFDHMLDICIEVPEDFKFKTLDIYYNSVNKLYSGGVIRRYISVNLFDIPHNEEVELYFEFFDYDGEIAYTYRYKTIFVYNSKRLEEHAREEILNYLTYNGDIKTIVIYDDISDEEFEYIAKMEKLEYVILRKNMPNNISLLQNLDYLKGLSLSETNLSNMNDLKSLSKIEVLDIKNTQVDDISVLSTFTELKKLYASNTEISKIDSLANLINLDELYLDGTKILDVSALSQLKYLKTLDISNTKVENIDGINKLVDMTNLNISSTQINGVNALEDMKKIERLNICNTMTDDLSSLRNTTEVISLNISNTLVRDLMPIEKNINLQILLADNTEVTNVLPLNNMVELKRLWLGGGEYVDMSGVENLVNLEELLLSDTKVINVEYIKFLGKLKWLSIFRCDIQDGWREYAPSGSDVSYSD